MAWSPAVHSRALSPPSRSWAGHPTLAQRVTAPAAPRYGLGGAPCCPLAEAQRAPLDHAPHRRSVLLPSLARLAGRRRGSVKCCCGHINEGSSVVVVPRFARRGLGGAPTSSRWVRQLPSLWGIAVAGSGGDGPVQHGGW
ncbi:hypothetical protein SEVIR_1G231650v4 [Setaria viridis]